MTEASATQLSLTDRTVQAGLHALSGKGRGLRRLMPFAGPAVIASVAYMDPGNFATNIQAGAKYNYDLLWVVVLASVVAMFFQALSAKLGIATGHNLAELSREHFPRPIVWAMWVASEIAAMATELAEFLGCAIGFSLLMGLPLLVGMVVTGAATFAILVLQRSGFRPLEMLIGGLVALIGASYLIELIIVPPDWAAIAFHAVVPRLDGADALTLAVGMVGATVMPHAIYLHSSLTQDRIVARNADERRKLIRFSNREVMFALGLAGLVNMAMVAMAAAVFHDGVHDNVASIETAYHTLIPLMGIGAAAVFLTSLIVSGLSSSVVGTMAGQVIMQGFVHFKVPLWLRRMVTMVPSIVVVALGVDATHALVLSQVVLSLVLPVPMIALLLLMRRRDVMGACVNGRFTSFVAMAAAIVVLGLNCLLVLETFGLLAASSAWLVAGFVAAGAFALPKLLPVAVAVAALYLTVRAFMAAWSGLDRFKLRWVPALADVRRRFEEHEKALGKLQAQLVQSQITEEFTQQQITIQREFIADAAHELRTPLSVLRVRVNRVKDEELADSFRDDIDAMSRMVNQLLDVAEMETLTVTPAERADLVSVCTETVAHIAPLALASGKDIELIGAEDPVWIRGNAEALQRAMLNLLSNAVKHTPAGTSVEIVVDPIGVVRVCDNGPGIAAEDKQNIFRRFWRGDRRRTGGAGLGLAIVSRIIGAHGGTIAVTDNIGGGTVFSVSLVAARLAALSSKDPLPVDERPAIKPSKDFCRGSSGRIYADQGCSFMEGREWPEKIPERDPEPAHAASRVVQTA
jgi:manganese transport protein